MIRVYAASSQTGTMLTAFHAAKTASKDTFDILIIDKVKKKKSLLELVYDSSRLHNWNLIIDLSTHIPTNYNLQANTRKKILRKSRNLPVFKEVYNFLQAGYLRKQKKEIAGEIIARLKEVIKDPDFLTEEAELNILPGLFINDALLSIFKKRKINYFEHGLGDYVYLSKVSSKCYFYSVFAVAFRKYLDKIGNTYVETIDYISSDEFDSISKKAFRCSAKDEQVMVSLKDKNCVLILLDAAEVFNPPDNFWTDYIDACLNQVEDYKKFTFLIKPHGLMTEYSQKKSFEYIRALGINYVIFDYDSTLFNVGAEILFARFKEKIAYVFSTYSTSIFFLPHFYPKEANYIYLYSFCKKYYQRAPDFYLSIFSGLAPLIKEVFTDDKNLNSRDAF